MWLTAFCSSVQRLTSLVGVLYAIGGSGLALIILLRGYQSGAPVVRGASVYLSRLLEAGLQYGYVFFRLTWGVVARKASGVVVPPSASAFFLLSCLSLSGLLAQLLARAALLSVCCLLAVGVCQVRWIS